MAPEPRVSIVLPFVGIAFVMVAIAHLLDKKQVGQKIMFIGSAMLFCDFALVATGNVAADIGYNGISQLTSGALVINTIFMLSWFLYMIARILTDLGENMMKSLGS